MNLILASTSRYRRQLLGRLRIPFTQEAPDVDESALPNESARELAVRLARQKALAVADQHAKALVLGSDQTLDCEGRTLGKAGTVSKAIAQLASLSGRSATFYTAVHATSGERHWSHLDTTSVRFRDLSRQEIERYVDADSPLDCAGSFKAEGLGIALFDGIHSEDPTALIGFPMIAIARICREAGILVP